MSYYCGLDEAGLGPVLGPYCGAAVTCSHPDTKKKNLFTLLENIVVSSPKDDNQLAIADSKSLYRSGQGLDILEETVFVALKLMGKPLPENYFELLDLLVPEGAPEREVWKEIPWFQKTEQLHLPLYCRTDRVIKKASTMKSAFEQSRFYIENIQLRMIPALLFNRMLDTYNSKGTVCLEIIAPLLQSFPKGEPKNRAYITVDRQGARKFYAEWLLSLFPREPLSVERETRDLSRYYAGPRSIDFKVKADIYHLETALASMFAKYTRECGMLLFNAYWRGFLPEIEPTAGYFADGRRFLKELDQLETLPVPAETLIRNK